MIKKIFVLPLLLVFQLAYAQSNRDTCITLKDYIYLEITKQLIGSLKMLLNFSILQIRKM